MMPEEKFGVVILTNMNGTGLPTALMRKIFDLQFKAPARDWSGEAYKRLETAARASGGGATSRRCTEKSGRRQAVAAVDRIHRHVCR